MSTLKEMAATLNLSVMAVSKALRDAPDISVGTKARVRAEARRRNYIPNRAAQNLRLRRSGLIGVVVPQINHTYYSHLVWGIERQAEASGLQVLLGSSLDRAENEMREVQKLIARQVEALLLVPAVRWQHRLATLEMVRASGIPTVLLDAYPAGAENFPHVSWVVCDDQRGGQVATDHLLELGHREILFLAGPNGSSSSAGRFSGYQRSLAAAGVAYTDTRVYLADKDIDSGRKAMAQALSEKAPFSAIVAHNDSVAVGAADTLFHQGFRIPEDVSIVGFGDGLLAQNFRVPLTTVRIPQVEMGEAAVRLAIDLQKGGSAEPRQLPVEIIVRESTKKRK
ncbi:MAG: LacI family transcriptional regulator [Methylacidiphilales bacterium]|nr:LacI family transcriptional regulator [Candidatus Methylacidiphilales bacterium]